MDTPASSEVIEKIRKLLAKANGTNNEHEAGAFLAKATELLQRYNLEMIDVTQKAEDLQMSMEFSQQVRGLKKNRWVQALANEIGASSFCTILIRGDSRVIFVGRTREAQTAGELFDRILSALNRLARVRVTEYTLAFELKYGFSATKAGPDHHPARYRLSWFNGAITGVIDQLVARREQFKAEGGTALMVVREDEARHWIQQNLHVEPARRRKEQHLNGRAFQQGLIDGSNLPLGGELTDH